MIVNCPKCGFTQPKDRYCAKCGVDMEAFRPKKAPLSSRILRSWIFQSAILIIAIGTALFFLRVQRARELQQSQIADYTKPPPLPGGQVALDAPPPPRPAQTPTLQTRATPAPPPPATSNQIPAARATGARGLVANPSAGARGATVARGGEANRDAVFTQIDIVYAEIPRTVLSNLEAGSRMLESDVIGVGIYPNILPLMRQLTQTTAQRTRSLRVLESARGLNVKINQPIITFKGMRDQTLDRNLGITSQIIPTGMDENGLHLQVEIQRSVRDPNSANGIAEYTYQGEISVTKGAGAFIAGLIPRRPLDPRDRAAYTNAGVLKILASQDFQDDLSEFVLFLEAR